MRAFQPFFQSGCNDAFSSMIRLFRSFYASNDWTVNDDEDLRQQSSIVAGIREAFHPQLRCHSMLALARKKSRVNILCNICLAFFRIDILSHVLQLNQNIYL